MITPFDKSLPSPIATIRELQARAVGAVVGIAGMTQLQAQAYIPTPVEERLSDLLLGEDPPHLVVVSGSAGGGKSALIARIESQHPDLFAEVVQDATHSDSPSGSQAEQLSSFFAPFADGETEPPSDGPRIIAANTGMLLQLFRQFGEGAGFRVLESTLKYRLGIIRERPAAAPWRLAVVNLDLRPTAGTDGLILGMVALLDFTNEEGILAGAPRCQTCSVRAWCPVRSNSILANHAGAAAIDLLAERAAVERSRHAGPRQLYDLISRALTGDDSFDGFSDPCDAVADAATREDREWVWDRLLPRSLFTVGGELGSRIRQLDPSLQPSFDAHVILARAGIRPEADADAVASLDPGGAEALAVAAEFVGSGHASREDVGRALIVAGFLAAPTRWRVGDDVTADFAALLDDYDGYSRDSADSYPTLEDLPGLLGTALARTFGILHGTTPYIPVKAYDPREPSRVFVNGLLRYDDGSYRVTKDPARGGHAGTDDVEPDKAADARLAGHQPLAVRVALAGVELTLTLPLYRLLREAERATLASTADLERFYGLRHAVEALARSVSAAGRELVVERPGTHQRFAVRGGRGLTERQRVIVEELSR